MVFVRNLFTPKYHPIMVFVRNHWDTYAKKTPQTEILNVSVEISNVLVEIFNIAVKISNISVEILPSLPLNKMAREYLKYPKIIIFGIHSSVFLRLTLKNAKINFLVTIVVCFLN